MDDCHFGYIKKIFKKTWPEWTNTPPAHHPLEVSNHSIGQWLDETFWYAAFFSTPNFVIKLKWW
jgi:hypothetical protein